MMTTFKKSFYRCATMSAAIFALSLCAQAQTVAITRATELRADKVAAAATIANLSADSRVRVLSLEGGWAWVESAGKQGWVRASSLNLQSDASAASQQSSGRQSAGGVINASLTLGVRSLGARSNRHALIIGIGEYADKSIPNLPGTKYDRESATQMAGLMQVPQTNITYLTNAQATGDGIRRALADLNAKVAEGDRVFIHYSGHGTRFNDPASGGCVEALLAYDGNEQKGMITNKEMGALLQPITQKTDKLFVMYDACHSGGLIDKNATIRTRGFLNHNDEGALRPKFAAISEECGRPVNVKTRNLLVEQTEKGALPQDVIHISAAQSNEVSFDDDQKGGLATQFVRDCMLREAKDKDGSGAISMEEIRACAQSKLDDRMRLDPNFKAHHLQLSGNAQFVPAWFAQATIAPTVSAPVSATPSTPTTTSTSVPAPAPTPVLAAAITGEQALRQMFDQRDAKRKVEVTMAKPQLKIGQDMLDFSVKSDRAGYVYVAMAGSDSQALTLLYPNDLDQNNAIKAGESLQLPRPNWRIRAGGPAGRNNLLVFVADAPRDLTSLLSNKDAKLGPFVRSLNDAAGRAQMGALMSTGQVVSGQACASPAARKSNPLCSDAYGALMVTVDEVR